MTISSLPVPPAPIAHRRWRPSVPWKAIRIITFYLILIGIWEVLALAEFWPSYVFPPPRAVFDTLRERTQSGEMFDRIELSTQRMVIGYSLSIVIGMTLGISMGVFSWVDEAVGSLLLGLQSVPNVAWLPFGLIWFGLNDQAIVFVVVMGSVSAMALSARGGVRSIQPLHLRAGRMFGGHPLQMYRYVILPGMLPSLVQGLRLGWSFAWHALMAAELLFASRSLGYLLGVGRDLNDMRLLVAGMIVIILIGVGVDRIVFGPIERRVDERWGLAA